MGQETREVKEPLLAPQQPTEVVHASEYQTDAASSPTGVMAMSVVFLSQLPDRVAHSDLHTNFTCRMQAD